MDVIEVIRNRRSIRLYQPIEVEKEKLQRVPEAARQAPSAAKQPPHTPTKSNESNRASLKKKIKKNT